jgi:16S rRNA (cytosine967-C5)-methyltransferase
MNVLVINNSRNSRQVALRICLQVVQHGQSLSRQLEIHLAELSDDRDKAFCTELCYGLCRYYFVLTGLLAGLLTRPLKARDQDVRIILLLGLYQIRFMRVEDHAAVNESVKLLRATKKTWAKGVVNAVLRSYLRVLEKDAPVDASLLAPAEHSQAYPDWIRINLENDWKDQAGALICAGNQRAPMVLRVDSHRISREVYLDRLKDQSISAIPHPLIAQAVVLDSPRDVEQIPGFDEALVSVQDSAAQIAAVLLDCRPGMTVLDACAAPGGKTLHILQACENLHLTALDKDELRLQRVAQNLRRAGLSARLVCADASDSKTWFDGKLFDRILLDVPCSASGIIRRHPDIRLLRQPQDIDKLVQVQRQLLDSMWKLLKPGGRLVYSTCSIFKAENELQIVGFMRHQQDSVERSLNTVQWGIQRPAGRQILTGSSNMDGFYYACLDKSETE